TRFLAPARDGAVRPSLHLNGYKISGPTVLGREDEGQVERLLKGHGYAPILVAGSDPQAVHRDFAAALDRCWDEIERIRRHARGGGVPQLPSWPAIALRTANGGGLLEDIDLPDYRAYAVEVKAPATERHESTRRLGRSLRDVFARNAGRSNFRLFCPDETHSNRLDDVFEVENRCFVGPIL